MKSQQSLDWVRLLPIAVKLVNSRPLKRNGRLPPNEISSFLDDPLLRKAKEESGTPEIKEPSYQKQNRSQQLYEKNSKLFQKNDFVYLDARESTFAKSFQDKVKKFLLNCCCVEEMFSVFSFQLNFPKREQKQFFFTPRMFFFLRLLHK